MRMPKNAFWWFVILPFTLIVAAIFGPLVWLFIWEMYPGMGEEHVHRIEAGDYLPRDDVEIRAKEYFKIDFTAACFLPGYFYFLPKEDRAFYEITLNYKGSFPSHFVLREDRWGMMFIKDNLYKIIYMVDMGYPRAELKNLPLSQAISSEKDPILCFHIKPDQDFTIQFKKSENTYSPINLSIK